MHEQNNLLSLLELAKIIFYHRQQDGNCISKLQYLSKVMKSNKKSDFYELLEFGRNKIKSMKKNTHDDFNTIKKILVQSSQSNRNCDIQRAKRRFSVSSINLKKSNKKCRSTSFDNIKHKTNGLKKEQLAVINNKWKELVANHDTLKSIHRGTFTGNNFETYLIVFK